MKVKEKQRLRYKDKMTTLRDIATSTGLDIRSISNLVNVYKYTADRAVKKLLEEQKKRERFSMGYLTPEQRKTMDEFKRIGDKEEAILKRLENKR